MVIALIVILLIALVVVFVQLANNYNTQVKVMRKFFRSKSIVLEDYLTTTSKLEDIDYESVFEFDTLDLYIDNESEGTHPLLLWIHGGGYVGGDKACAEAWGRIIARKTGLIVASMNYKLAPEQHYPGPIIQVGEALAFLRRNAASYHIDPDAVFLAGDSAGAQIASQFAAVVTNAALRDRMKLEPALQAEQLKGVLLCCGMYNMDTVIKTGFPAIKTFLWVYTNERHFMKKFARLDELSTVKHITPDYPDVFITCGDADPFITQAHEMIAALSAAGTTCDSLLFDGSGKKLGHEYQFNLGQRDANAALMRAIAFLTARLPQRQADNPNENEP